MSDYSGPQLAFCKHSFDQMKQAGKFDLYLSSCQPQWGIPQKSPETMNYLLAEYGRDCIVIDDGDHFQLYLCLDCIEEMLYALAKATDELVFVERVGT